MKDDYLMMGKEINESLAPGKMDDMQFLLLIEISSIHSKKVIQALGDYLVYGYSRKESCSRYNVSLGYFSYALKRLNRVNQAVSWIAPFYIKEKPVFSLIANG